MPAQVVPSPALMDTVRAVHFGISDGLRRAQANALDTLGLGPRECDFAVIASGPHWRLREYGGADGSPSLLIVPAPIKRPYIWDLTPSVSAVRLCLQHGLRVYLIQWMPPSGGNGCAGLDEYAGEAIAECVATIARQARKTPPFLVGHSLGGTLAAIYCALEPSSARGLVLLASPLCFERQSSRFRDALVSFIRTPLSETEAVAGSLLSQASAAASPDTFLWSRWMDAVLSLADPSALDIHARIERWALDEVALPGKLVNQIIQELYRDNHLCRGTLRVRGKIVGPASFSAPLLAVVNADDEIAPVTSVAPFVARLPRDNASIIECPGEVGIALPHLGMLAGRQAHAQVWPQIIYWMRER
jgi:polyhydroxyalkanoate synthase